MEQNDPEPSLLTRISQLFASQGDAIFTGSSTLCLPAPILAYILQKPTSSEHTRVQASLRQVIAMKVVDDQSTVLKCPLNLSMCKSLHTLELKRIPLNMVKGLQFLREQLKTVVVQRCLNDVEDLLIFCGGDESLPHNWTNLTQLNLSHNSVTMIGRALKYLPSLKVLDLSFNCLSDDYQGLYHLVQLEQLFMGHNQLLNIPCIKNTHLAVLNLCYNRIESLHGLEGLIHLRKLDLQYNCITRGPAMLPLIHLHCLEELNLVGNPISYHPKYGYMVVNTISTLVNPSKFTLDGIPLSSSQKKILRLRPSIASFPSSGSQPGVSSSSKAREDVTPGYHSADETPTSELDVSGVWAMSESLNTPKLRKKRVRAVKITDGQEQLDISESLRDSFLDAPEAQRNKERRKQFHEGWLQTMPDTNIQKKREKESIKETSSVPCEDPGIPELEAVPVASDGSESEEDNLEFGETFIVEMHESDTDDDLSKEDKKLLININERFLVERNVTNAKVKRQLDLHCLMDVESKEDYLRLSFDSTRRDSRRIEYSTSTGDAEKLKDILLPYATHNKQNMIISPRYECLNCGGIFLKKEAIVIEDPSKYVSHELSTQQYQCPLCHSSYYVELEPTTVTTTALGTASPITVSSVHQPEEELRVTSTEYPREDVEATEDIDHTGDESVEDVPGVDNVEIQKSSEESSLENQSESAEFKTPEAVSLHEESLMMDDLLLEHSSLKLYMECEVFEGEIEHLEMMIKVGVITRSKDSTDEEECLLVISSSNAYFFKILQPHLVEASSSLAISSKQPLNSLVCIEIGPDYQFLFLDFQNCAYLLMFRDYRKCKDFSDKLPVIVSDVPNPVLLGIKVSDITTLSLWYEAAAQEPCPVEAYIGLHCYYAISGTTNLMQSGRNIDGKSLVEWMADHLDLSEPLQSLCQGWLDVGVLLPRDQSQSTFDESQSYMFNMDKWVKTKFDVVMQPKQKYFMCCSFEGVEHSSRTVSIIVVDTALCLLEDNYFQWPMSKLGHVSHTGMYTPPYKLIAKKSVTDISSVSLIRSDNKVYLYFFEDDSSLMKPWIIQLQSFSTCSLLINLISDQWKFAFGVSLNVIYN